MDVTYSPRLERLLATLPFQKPRLPVPAVTYTWSTTYVNTTPNSAGYYRIPITLPPKVTS